MRKGGQGFEVQRTGAKLRPAITDWTKRPSTVFMFHDQFPDPSPELGGVMVEKQDRGRREISANFFGDVALDKYLSIRGRVIRTWHLAMRVASSSVTCERKAPRTAPDSMGRF